MRSLSEHVGYPHEPGRLYDCPECERRCYCGSKDTECVFCAEHPNADGARVVEVRAVAARATFDTPEEVGLAVIECERAGWDRNEVVISPSGWAMCQGDFDHPEHEVKLDDGGDDDLALEAALDERRGLL